MELKNYLLIAIVVYFIYVNCIEKDNFNNTGYECIAYWAPWCGWSLKLMKGAWKELPAEHNGCVIKDVDVTTPENKHIPQQKGIKGFPTIRLEKGGKVVKVFKGERTKASILKFIEVNM